MPIIEGATSAPLLNAGAPVNGIDEVQLLTYTATTGTAVADSGTFKITFDGFTTTALAFDATANAVRDALLALPNIGAAGVTVTLAAGPPRVYTVTFGGGNMLKRALPLMTVATSLLQAAAVVNVVVTESVAGVSATQLGALPGAQLFDTTNGVHYTNAGTALAPVWTRNAGGPLNADGLGVLGVARFTFDAGVAANRTVAAHGTGVTLPAHAIVVGGFFDVNTVFTSTGGNGTIAISVEAANDIQTAASIAGAPYSTIGRKAIVPKANTPESTAVKTTVAREITCTVAVNALLTGKLTGWLYYLVSVASA